MCVEANRLETSCSLYYSFLKALGVEYSDLEPLASGCTEVLVWHTQTERSQGLRRRVRPSHLADSNLPALLEQLKAAGVLEMLDGEAKDALPVCLKESCA